VRKKKNDAVADNVSLDPATSPQSRYDADHWADRPVKVTGRRATRSDAHPSRRIASSR
jgi:hypothetical protein